MCVLDFLIAMVLLAKIVSERKLDLLFKLCDDDEDGFMTDEDVLDMLERIQRVFNRDGREDEESLKQNHVVANQKAEQEETF